MKDYSFMAFAVKHGDADLVCAWDGSLRCGNRAEVDPAVIRPDDGLVAPS